jgi:bifunctional oligoribonuclease and PAP phosphatase NrnA
MSRLTAAYVKERLDTFRPVCLPFFGRRESAVLVPLVERSGELYVILTRRAPHLVNHAGEISFPGGAREAEDGSSWETALREANEEINLDPSACESLGRLDDSPTISHFNIRPHVALVNGADNLVPSDDEVSEIIEVPLQFFVEAGAGFRIRVEHGRVRGGFPLYPYEGQIIWGATARLLANLVRVLDGDNTESGIAGLARDLVPRLNDGKKFILTTHVNPDPDGIGALIAMEELLLAMGKEVLIAVNDPIPERFPFLKYRSPTILGKKILEEHARDADLMIVLDTGDVGRIGKAARLLPVMDGRVAVIDHHLAGNITGAAVLVDRRYSCASEMVYELLRKMGFPWTQRAVDALYAGIQFDTNGFRYINDRAEPLRVAGHLVALGAASGPIQEALFGTVTMGQVEALTIALGKARKEFGGRWMWSWISEEELAKFDGNAEDAGEISSFFVSVGAVRVATFMRELPDGRYKASFRSKRAYPIGDICKQFGGGGHANAGGATLPGPAEHAASLLREMVGRVVNVDVD